MCPGKPRVRGSGGPPHTRLRRRRAGPGAQPGRMRAPKARVLACSDRLGLPVGKFWEGFIVPPACEQAGRGVLVSTNRPCSSSTRPTLLDSPPGVPLLGHVMVPSYRRSPCTQLQADSLVLEQAAPTVQTLACETTTRRSSKGFQGPELSRPTSFGPVSPSAPHMPLHPHAVGRARSLPHPRLHSLVFCRPVRLLACAAAHLAGKDEALASLSSLGQLLNKLRVGLNGVLGVLRGGMRGACEVCGVVFNWAARRRRTKQTQSLC
jgi:hypothetical protein